MGFLDNSTNNIILDAVLTDTGRQFIAKQDGSFLIHKFAFSDDEVDYSIIQKYGRQIGREKIEKNTPIFEAITNQSQSQKYKLVSISNPNLTRLPKLDLINTTSNTITLGRNNKKYSAISIDQSIQDGSTIDVELRDQTFTVELNNLFLEVQKEVPELIDGYQKATYLLTRSSSVTSASGSKLEFTINVKSISDTLFTTYGTTQNKSQIKTYVKVVGLQSGAVKEFTVVIDKNV